MALKPWFKVVTPREDLRDERPLDASEFAVHLDQVRDLRAPDVYTKPREFFARTFLTRGLTDLAAEMLRRLAGEAVGASPVVNLTTQFGGGKTHGLTLLYHLARSGPEAAEWTGVRSLLGKAGVASVPEAATAVFVGTEFDSLTGRGGDGEPVRRTPWGEIAWQLGGAAAFAAVEEHDRRGVRPGGDVIRKMLPSDRPVLVLMDEVLNYLSSARAIKAESGQSYLSTQFVQFLQSLAAEAAGRRGVCLVMSLPSSNILEISSEDQSDYERIVHLSTRTDKPFVLSEGFETGEIIRRRLIEWEEFPVTDDGRPVLPRDAHATCTAYAEWLRDNRQHLPQWFPIDDAKNTLIGCYPFHPVVFSVFERKWQSLPRFQRTRGVLRMLALWTSHTFAAGFKGAHADPLIGLGMAPLDSSLFRSAVFEQLGEDKLDVAVTTDIAGRKDAHAARLDADAVDTIRKARLHRKAAAAIFFESNGGLARADANFATVPEVRLAIGEPDLAIGNVETVVESLQAACYYLTVEGNRYRFGLQPNLNKLLADRQASIRDDRIDETARAAIQRTFPTGQGVHVVPFPKTSGDIADRPALTFVIVDTTRTYEDEGGTRAFIERLLREHGAAARTYKNALVFCIADAAGPLRDAARKLLAWQDIRDEAPGLPLDEGQRRQLGESLQRAERDLKEAVWRTYRRMLLLGGDNALKVTDLGLRQPEVSLINVMLNQLRLDEDAVLVPSPVFLTRRWPGMMEWSTRSVRDAFFAAPQFPRLLNPESIKETIAKGVAEGMLAYVGKKPGGGYHPFTFETTVAPSDIEISDEMFIITRDEALKHKEPPQLTRLEVSPSSAALKPGAAQSFTARALDQHGREMAGTSVTWGATGGTIGVTGVFRAGEEEGAFTVTARAGHVASQASVTVQRQATTRRPEPPQSSTLTWEGEVPPLKWMNFYTKVLSRFVTGGNLAVRVHFEVTGASKAQDEETKSALRELGLQDGHS